MTRGWLAAAICASILAGTLAAAARAGDGNYTIAGGTAREQAQVRLALQASSFDWGVLPPVAVRLARGAGCYATPGEVVLDTDLLDAGRFSWGVVQHEFAHELDFLLLDDDGRSRLAALLGGRAWWPAAGIGHDDLTSERFAALVAWSYWPADDNVMRPDGAAAAEAAGIRGLLPVLLPARARKLAQIN